MAGFRWVLGLNPGASLFRNAPRPRHGDHPSRHLPAAQAEIDWFYQRGASVLYPDAWEPYASHIPEAERSDLLMAYYRRLTSEDRAVRLAAAKIWSTWEGATSKLLPDAAFTAHYEEDEFALAFARIEAHYFVNKGFMKTDGQLLEDTSRIRYIPGVIVQGRYDVVCPMESAWALHRHGRRPNSSLHRIAAIAASIHRTVAPSLPRLTDSQTNLAAEFPDYILLNFTTVSSALGS